MTEDAQNAEFDADLQGQQPAESEAPADSSPDSGENHEQKHNSVQARINEITAQKYEEKRRADALQAELEKLKTSAAAPVQEEAKPDSNLEPKLPDDIYDEDAMRKYHADVIAYNKHLAQQASQTASKTWEQQQKEAAQRAKQQETIQNWNKNAIKDGVDFDKLHGAEQVLNNAGINDQLADHIMRDPNGPKIATYLADNPALMYEILSLDPISAALKLANEVKPQALSTTPRVSNAPPPTPEINGGGMVEKDDFSRIFPGAEFI